MSELFVPFALIERDGIPESHHSGAAVLADSAGKVLAAWGDPDFVTFPRSALKPFQALPLIESGAFDALNLTDRHLALACASHAGESFHAAIVEEWLGRLGCGPECLACGPALPGNRAAALARVEAKLPPSPVLHNCSGKHCGFLTTARHLGWPIAGYQQFDHPVQHLYRAALSRFIGRNAAALPWSRDDCTLPAPALSMREMAVAAARLAAQAEASPGAAPARILAAMRDHPLLVAGTGGLPEVLNRIVGGEVLAKTGAEAYLATFIPSRGLGLALKVADGNARARDCALISVLAQTGLIEPTRSVALETALVPPIVDSRGQQVGRIRCTLPERGAQH